MTIDFAVAESLILEDSSQGVVVPLSPAVHSDLIDRRLRSLIVVRSRCGVGLRIGSRLGVRLGCRSRLGVVLLSATGDDQFLALPDKVRIAKAVHSAHFIEKGAAAGVFLIDLLAGVALLVEDASQRIVLTGAPLAYGHSSVTGRGAFVGVGFLGLGGQGQLVGLDGCATTVTVAGGGGCGCGPATAASASSGAAGGGLGATEKTVLYICERKHFVLLFK